MSRRLLHPVHRFSAPVAAAGLGLLVFSLATAGELVPPGAGIYVALLAPGLVLAELMPLRIPRRGDDEEITLATTFAFGLLIVAGLPVAALVQALASVLQDAVARKPVWRWLFNAAQYTVSLGAAMAVMRALGVDPLERIPFSPADLPAIAAGAVVYFAVNSTLVGAAVARYQGVDLLTYYRSDLAFSVATGAVLLSLAPVVLAAIDFSPWLFAACLLPLAAIHEAARQAARVERHATTDSLTGLANRARIEALTARAIDERTPFALLLMDLNRFREINDTLGHRHGDLLLRQVAERLRAGLREEDVVARLGGDEFAILAPGDAGVETAERLRALLATPFDVERLSLELVAGIGIASWPGDGAGFDALLRAADIAMYHAKRAHLPHAAFRPEQDQHSPARLALAADLRRALDEEDELIAHYQPQVDLAERRAPAVEALVRWSHPSLGMLGPGAFLEVAEGTGLIRALGLRVLEVALADRQAWQREGLDLQVAVNVSVRSLLDRQFPAQVAQRLARAGCDPGCLRLEITESSIMADPSIAMEVLGELAEMGMSLAVDDFGTGYSSLSYLKQLPVDELKIDRSFVTSMVDDRDDLQIVRSTVELGHNLGLRVVAEGVETGEALDELDRQRCDGAQGYHLGRPVAAASVRAAIRRAGALLHEQGISPPFPTPLR